MIFLSLNPYYLNVRESDSKSMLTYYTFSDYHSNHHTFHHTFAKGSSKNTKNLISFTEFSYNGTSEAGSCCQFSKDSLRKVRCYNVQDFGRRITTRFEADI